MESEIPKEEVKQKKSRNGRDLLILLLLLLIPGTYYCYSTNAKFRELVSSYMNPEKPNDAELAVENDTVQEFEKALKEKEEPRKKIPKVLRRDEFYKLDEYARKAPKQYEKDIETLAKYLIIPAKTELQKARVLFTWVATHVEYDDEGFNSGDLSKRDYSAKNVLETKKGVCEGYSNLLEALCKTAGLEAENVEGYSKGYSYVEGTKFTKTTHAWNVIKIDNQWRLFDATWANGYGTNTDGKLVSTVEFEPYWFDVDPREFLFTHLPKHPKWELVEPVIRLEQFEDLPNVDESFFKLGFNADKVFNDAAAGKLKQCVETYKTKFPLSVIELPYTQNVRYGDTINFTVASDYAESMAVIDGETFYYFKKDGNVFKLSHAPKTETLRVSVKINWFDESYWSVAKYKVVGGPAAAAK